MVEETRKVRLPDSLGHPDDWMRDQGLELRPSSRTYPATDLILPRKVKPALRRDFLFKAGTDLPLFQGGSHADQAQSHAGRARV